MRKRCRDSAGTYLQSTSRTLTQGIKAGSILGHLDDKKAFPGAAGGTAGNGSDPSILQNRLLGLDGVRIARNPRLTDGPFRGTGPSGTPHL